MKPNSKITIIGGVPIPGRDSSFGGTTVLMQNLIDYCSQKEIPFSFISTNKYEGKLAFVRNLLHLIRNLFSVAQKSKILLVNISSYWKGPLFIYPIALLYSKATNKSIVFRMFGGVFHKKLEEKSWLRSIALYQLRKSDLTLVETLDMRRYFESHGIRVSWYPNVRTASSERRTAPFSKRFVFISHIKESKGVDLILQVSNQLPEGYTIDLYGPIVDEKYTPEYFSAYRAQYRGVLAPQEVRHTLSLYDMLLLPTHWLGEGYPGIVIEGFSVGVPCIASQWGGIPEMIRHQENGLLIPPQDTEALRQAILSVDAENYESLSTSALQSFEDYEDDLVNARIIGELSDLCK